MALDNVSSFGLLSGVNQNNDYTDFDSIKISLASPEKIRSWSYGEVTKPETINYRTLKPERDGLFCARIFGPIKDYECLCGKYKRIKYKGIICEKCGVEVTKSKVRRERMGHIELAAPVSHIWFLKSLPSRISTILDIMPKYVEKIIYFESYVVTDARMTELENGQLLSEDEYNNAKLQYGEDAFEAQMGAEAIRKLLENIDLMKLKIQLRKELKEIKSDIKKAKIIKRLKLVESFIESNNRPEWMILTSLPVISPEIRPLVALDGGHFATSDLNELYRKVINRNNRLKRLIELDAPDIIIRNEKRMLQESVDSLMDNTRSTNVVKSASKRPYKSLSDTLKGKQGRFRQNLLGKRVDYSGRSVIVVGPYLELNQCGLPKKMALELFEPFICAKLRTYGLVSSIKAAKKKIKNEDSEVWDILEEITKEHVVLLNRAPTLHRISIQAFEPLLIEGKAIQLHPLVCKSFNADFDGDQMSVHIPLSIESQIEARVLMMSTNNILHPQDGNPVIIPSMEMVLGIYYLTMNPTDQDKKIDIAISSKDEMDYALFTKRIDLHDKIMYRYVVENESGEMETKKIETTAGRQKIYNSLPRAVKNKYGFEIVNKELSKKEIGGLINLVFKETNQEETVKFCDDIKDLGFKFATLSGVSIGKDDMSVSKEKSHIVEESFEEIKKIDKQYQNGLITAGERYNKIIDAWGLCGSKMKKMTAVDISKGTNPKEINALYIMLKSGARGSEGQIQQMCGMRGLMSKPNGEIIETPILSNFKEGLKASEYFLSAHGGRKGVIDTALKTANAGYLTRRLVDVAQDCIIVENDCGSIEGITMEAKIENGKVIMPLYTKILGRTALEDIYEPKTKKLISKAGELINEKEAEEIEKSGILEVKVRSVLGCKLESGVCSKCYGRDLSTRREVSLGEAVGVIAAQSIGEPGTQLTMNTKHLSGATSGDVAQSSIISNFNANVKINNLEFIVNREEQNIVINRKTEFVLFNDKNQILVRYNIPFGSIIKNKDGDKIQKGDHLADWDPYNTPIIALKKGTIDFKDLLENISIKERIDEGSGISTKIIIDWRKYNSKIPLKPLLVVNSIDGEVLENELFIGTILSVVNKQEVEEGDIIAKIPRETSRSKDITGGLPRITELFEARRPKNFSIMAHTDGIISFDKDYRIKKRMIIEPNNPEEEKVEYMVPKGKFLFVNDGDQVKKGDILMDGNPVPHDILRILGVEKFAKYMVEETQKVYGAQGIDINEKHVEIILKMMLKKVEVINSGETTLILGEHMDRDDFEETNEKAREEGIEEAKAETVLLGITKASLQTKSFISAASFQETTKILIDAALQGKSDSLWGLKENIMVGKLIPAGTGFLVRKFKEEALENKIEDEDILISED